MNIHLIELSDNNIRVSNQQEVILTSPGFANINHDQQIYGGAAQQIARKQPHQTFNQFWSQLSLEPLANANAHFRHHADLAYQHLCNIAETCELEAEVVFAVPSHYSREQLSILLGLAEQCPFNTIGLIDLALLNMAAIENNSAIFLDFQLHRTVLTTVSRQNGFLIRDKVVSIPATGLLALQDVWANMITDEFIKQCRFDPQHNAETEQYIYSQLNHWLTLASTQKEVLLEINNIGTAYQATVLFSDFAQKAAKIFTRIGEELSALITPQTSVYLSDSASNLPGVSGILPSFSSALTTLPVNGLLTNCFTNIDHIIEKTDAIHFKTQVPVKNSDIIIPTQADAMTLPSHLLVNHKAHPLPSGRLYIGSKNTEVLENTDNIFIEIEDDTISEPLTIIRQPQGYYLQYNPATELLINGEICSDSRLIEIGDQIELINSKTMLQFIQV